MNEKYEKLDALILNSIGGHPKMFGEIYAHVVMMECERLEKSDRSQSTPRRYLDRRLQALRKAGKIRSTTKGWIRA